MGFRRVVSPVCCEKVVRKRVVEGLAEGVGGGGWGMMGGYREGGSW